MEQLENNIFFWQKLDTLLLSSAMKIDRPKGSTHFKYANLVYPVDYGYLADTTGSDQSPIDVFRGTKPSDKVEGIAVSADILKRDCEVKLIVGCTDDELRKIMEFLNQTEFQKAIFIGRGHSDPSWASHE
jgi:inorganic pyrophosphatase